MKHTACKQVVLLLPNNLSSYHSATKNYQTICNHDNMVNIDFIPVLESSNHIAFNACVLSV